MKTTQKSTTTTKAVVTTAPQIVCSADGFYAYPGDCTRFYRCVFGHAYIFSCPAGTGWNQPITTCDFKTNIPGCV